MLFETGRKESGVGVHDSSDEEDESVVVGKKDVLVLSFQFPPAFPSRFGRRELLDNKTKYCNKHSQSGKSMLNKTDVSGSG